MLKRGEKNILAFVRLVEPDEKGTEKGEKDFNFDIDYKQYEIEISDFFSCSVFPIKLKKIVIYETKEIEKEFNFSEEKDGIINAEIVNIERDLPQGAQKTRYWYFEKIVDKNTYLDLYYEIVVKLA